MPCYKNFVNEQPPAEQMQDALDTWAGQWGRPSVIVGTHPGGCASTFGAMAAASVVVTPVIFGTRELAALDGWLGELPGYPFLIIPNRLARGLAKEWSLRKLTRIVEAASVPVGPPVSEHGWLKDRQLRMALTADGPAAGLRVRKGRREHGSRRRGSEAYGTAA